MVRESSGGSSCDSSSISDDHNGEEGYRSIEFGVVGWEERDESHYTDPKYRRSQMGNQLLQGFVATNSDENLEGGNLDLDDVPAMLSDINGDAPTASSTAKRRSVDLSVQSTNSQQETKEDSDDSVGSGDDPREGRPTSPFIQFSTEKLYGRDKELAKLQNVYNQLIENNQSQAVFISAYSGSGKTRLVYEAVKQFTTNNNTNKTPRFVHAKHEEQERYAPVPYKAISEAFQKWYTKLSRAQQQRLCHIQRELNEAVGDDVAVLVEILPSLRRLIEGDENESYNNDDSTATRSITAQQHEDTINKSRLHFAFQCFLKCLCTEENPLIMYIDDLQWADAYTLELLGMLLSDSSMIQHLLFIGAYRSNEVNPNDHPLSRIINQLQSKQKEHPEDSQLTHVEVMELSDLSKDDVGEFIADTLELEKEEVMPLTEAIYRKTLGNIFFTRQALEQLVRRNALYFDMVVFCWQWRLPVERLEEALSDDIIEMVKSKIECLPPELQRALAVAAHTRSTLDINTLVELLSEYHYTENGQKPPQYTAEDLINLLDRAVMEGLLDVGTAGAAETHEYSFAHDRIREASQSFITGEALHQLSYTIGNVLAKRGSDDSVGEDWMLFTALHHLNSVPSKYHGDDDARLRMAKLNLVTAKLAMGRAAYEDVAKHAEKGIEFLSKDRWEKCTVLCHELYALAAEASRLIGNIPQMERYCTACLTAERERPWEANYQVYYTLATGLFYGSDRYGEAKTIVINLLKHLDCRFPNSVTMTKSTAVLKVVTLVSTKKHRTASEVEKMEFMTSPTKIKAMKLLDKLFDICYITKDELLLTLVIFRALEYTLKYGLSVYSPRLIASVCVVFTGALNDLKGGGLYADYALQMMRKVNHKPVEAGTLLLSYIFGKHWVTPVGELIAPLRYGYQVGWNTGDAENASWCLFYIICFSMHAGKPLYAIDSDAKIFVPRLEEMGQRIILIFLKAVWRTVLGIMGLPKQHAQLSLSEAETDTVLVIEALALFLRKEQAYLGDYELCAESALKHGDGYVKAAPGAPQVPPDTALCAVSCMEMVRQTGRSDYLKEAKRLRKLLNSWAKQGNPNLLHWKALLDAEFAAHKRQGKLAIQNFQTAVDTAMQGGYIHDAAVANERWATYLLHCASDEKEAQIRMHEAARLCAKWGAAGKIQRLKEKFPNLMQHYQLQSAVR